MYHSFRVDIATKYGIEEAIFLQNLYFWIEKNKANGKHYYDGYYWTYNTQKAFTKLFPYMSQSKVSRMGKKLEELGLIKTKNYNKAGYDRTKWYSLTRKAETMLKDCNIANMQNEYSNMQNDQTNMQNEYSIMQNDLTIPDTNTDINTDTSTLSSGSENQLTKDMKDKILEEWNKLNLQNLRSINENTNRYKMLKARIEEYSYKEVLEAIGRINKSSFLKGQNKRNWTITFDWLIRPNNFIKVLEGNYDDKGGLENESNQYSYGARETFQKNVSPTKRRSTSPYDY